MIDRKEQILDLAADLLQTRSFNSFSYQDLSDRLGIRKASIHHHFPSKDDLGSALAERYRERTRQSLEAVDRRYDRPWDRLEAYLGHMTQVAQSGRKICPVGIMEAEHNVIPERMRDAGCALAQDIHRWMTGVLEAGRSEGSMHYPGSAEDQAAFILAAMQGALQNARAFGPKHFTAIARQVRDGLKGKAK